MSLVLVSNTDSEFIAMSMSGTNKSIYDFIMKHSFYVKDGRTFLKLLDYDEVLPLDVTDLNFPTEEELEFTDNRHEEVADRLWAIINLVNSKSRSAPFSYFGDIFGRIVYPPMANKFETLDCIEFSYQPTNNYSVSPY